MTAARPPLRIWISALSAAALAGCAVGPDFKSPAAPAATYGAAPLPAQTASAPAALGQAQALQSGQAVPADWWTAFHCDKLNTLVTQALRASPDLHAAQANLRQAQESYAAQRGSTLFPQVDARLSGSRNGSNRASQGQTGDQQFIYNLFNASVGVSYTLDLTGGVRRQLEALAAQVDYQRYQLDAAWLTLSANVVTTAIAEAQLRESIRVTEDIAAAQRHQLDITQKRFDLGAVPRSDVLSLQVQLQQTLATLPALHKQLESTRHALAALAGRYPGDALPEFTLNDFSLPPSLPVSVPSTLVRQRPDIQASEALLHQATAEVGVAVANLYPQITLDASFGSAAAKAGSLFKAGSSVWGVGAGLVQPLFNGGLSAARRAALASYDAAYAHYRQTVISAFQSVADTLSALQTDAQALQAQAEAERSASEALDLVQQQYQLGAASYLQLLVAQQQQLQSRLSLASAQAQRLADSAATFEAMGGGWWNSGGSGPAGLPYEPVSP
jgi:NodT family efflux transporter outer membrane factor (OMF) lipoprotein